ncbi:MAG: glutamine--fructose-6-phosphate aminotransferase [Candidatus Rokuibacteriota bacterium]|nr:MAG: glutamine--fructose-6-phosphate aminotransferase [Candidatus Rokubacteria bacterium]
MTWTPPPPRSGHPYFMHDAIYAQPGALRLVTRGNEAALDAAAARLAQMERIVLSGIGTSWHACLVGELLMAHAGRLGHRVRAFHSFELKSYWPDFDQRTGVIVVSHRGSKRYSREALEKAKGSAGVGITITGKGHDLLTMAEITLRTVEQENSAAHTVSYTCAMTLLASLAARLGRDADIAHELGELPDHVAQLLGQESWEDLASRFADRKRYYFIGGGPNTATAFEAALKMNEANHSTAIGYNCEQFMHGPSTSLDADDVVFVIALPGAAYERCLMVARAAREVGAPVVALARDGDREIGAVASETIAIPAVNELVSPILTVVPLQLFTYHLALARGVNPDLMRADVPEHGRARSVMSL